MPVLTSHNPPGHNPPPARPATTDDLTVVEPTGPYDDARHHVDPVRPHSTTVYDDVPRRRRVWPIVVGLSAAGALIVAGVVLSSSSGSSDETAEPVTLRAVTAETVDLVEYTDIDGTMTYADTTSVITSGDGTITAVAAAGGEVARGSILYEVNGSPTVALYGDAPMYRDLSEGVTGDDVVVLEQNLASLGYNSGDEDDDGNPVDEGFVVDGEFDSATAEAVSRWQDDVGVEPTGVVSASSVLVIDGPSSVSNVAVDVGARVSAGTPVLDLNARATTRSGVFTNRGGEVEVLVAAGDELVSGDVVYSVDDAPVTAIVTDVEFDRDLSEGVDDGADVRVIEEMLVALGYDADGELVVDETYDEFTTSAVEDWQEDLQNTFESAEVTGEVSLDDVVVVEPGTVVGTSTPPATTTLASGTELWSTETASATRIVSTSIPVADQDQLALGAEVDVEFPDGEIVTGTVTEVASSSTSDASDPEAEAELAVEISLPTVPESVASLDEVDVVVKLVDEVALQVTAVPVSALVATGDGGFAVQTVDGSGVTQFVAVDPGMFIDGFVEVSGISAGTQVVVPT
jgi:peptidoglycan hydrolase-like protein with peptidoglycan-binding domain